MNPFKDSVELMQLKYWNQRYEQHLKDFRSNSENYNPVLGVQLYIEIARLKLEIVKKSGWSEMKFGDCRVVTDHFQSVGLSNVMMTCWGA